jgi:hypothetical protein
MFPVAPLYVVIFYWLDVWPCVWISVYASCSVSLTLVLLNLRHLSAAKFCVLFGWYSVLALLNSVLTSASGIPEFILGEDRSLLDCAGCCCLLLELFACVRLCGIVVAVVAVPYWPVFVFD